MTDEAKDIETASWLFADRGRGIRTAGATAILALLMLWIAFGGPKRELRIGHCQIDASRCEGRRITVSLKRVHAFEDGLIVVRAGETFATIRPPDGIPQELKVGMPVSAAGPWVEERQRLEAVDLFVHEDRSRKEISSIAGLALVMGLALWTYRIDLRRGRIVERRPNPPPAVPSPATDEEHE